MLSHAPLGRLRVLTVEDEAIVGLDLADVLDAAGYSVAGPVGSCADALAWLAVETPDAAILDVDLQHWPCTEVACELHRRGVPYLVYSGHSRGPDTEAVLQGVPWLMKPVAYTDLLQVLGDLVLVHHPEVA